MAIVYENVRLVSLTEDGETEGPSDSPFKIVYTSEQSQAKLDILNGSGKSMRSIKFAKDHSVEVAKVGKLSVLLSVQGKASIFKLHTDADAKSFHRLIRDALQGKQESIFSQRTDAASAEQYFQFYGYLSQQQNMMQDYIRTSTYQRAMLDNSNDFQDKVVLDVGAGSGILSFFAVQAGAKKVYAIEASDMALHCEHLVASNKLSDRIVVIPGKIEEVDLPEKVDIIISEPMGYMLFNERMLETYLHAKKWLKPNGQMFPTQGDLHIAPFTDETLYTEQFSKANFWYQHSFHGVDLTGLRQAAINEYFKQPIVDTFDIRICMARSHKYTVNFQTAVEADLHNIEIPVTFTVQQAGTCHGLAFWFDVAFIGTLTTVWLSTTPTQPLTHWYQVRCLLENPIFVKQGQTLTGKVILKCNNRQSYDVDIELTVPGSSSKSRNVLDLKNPFFRYTGQTPQPPPGTNYQSPSDAYWNNTDPTAQVDGQTYTLTNIANCALTDLQGHQLVVQQGSSHPQLVPLANVAPINPGSIPAATVVNNVSQGLQTRTSIGAGISPSLFSQITSSNNYPISNQFMIGDYAAGNMIIPTQGLANMTNYKTSNNL